jgi:SAM-dependent methyltransferase
MLAAGRHAALRAFIDRYEIVRRAEGRRIEGPQQLLALPFRDLTRRHGGEWAIRSRSFGSLVRVVVAPLGARAPLDVIDLGSGVGWLAYRLARRGHRVAAVDLLTGDDDGLGAHRHFDRPLLAIQAEFDRLPFADASVDLAVYNASLHYAADYATTLREGLRVLRPGGRLVVMDTPIYRDAARGASMVRERAAAFEARFGFREDATATEGFLTYDRLGALARELDLRWQIVQPWYGLRWWLEPLRARLRGAGAPARFKLIVGTRAAE